MGLDDMMSQSVAWLAQIRDGLIAALPSLATALLVVLVGWGLAWALRRVVLGAFRRIVLRLPPGLSRRAWAEAVDEQQAGQMAAAGLYWLVLALTAVAAIDALDIPRLSQWMGELARFLPSLAVAAAILIAGIIAGRIARHAILQTGGRGLASQRRSLARLVHAALVAAAVLIAAAQLGIDVSLMTNLFLIVLSAALGAAALAFGLGARGAVADIVAMHYLNQSYRIGQVVRIGSDQGKIVRTTRTAVLLESPEGELSIPGRVFADQRCVLLNEETDGGA
jgi:small-conductance mechanosensitive channel